MRGFFVGLLCLIAACGGGEAKQSLCDRYASIDLSSKIGKCDVTAVGLPTKTACENAMPSCNSDDTRQLEGLLDCLSALDNCKVGQETSWLDQGNSCFARLDLSSGCAGALE